MKASVGNPAVPFFLKDTAGALHRLEDYAGKWLLLVFHRHLRWLPCREHLSQLRQHRAEIESLGLEVLVVTFEAVHVAADYVVETGLPWSLLLDPTRSLYEAYGMGRGQWWKIWGPATLWAYARLVARGERPRRPTGDVGQLGGDVLIDRGGKVAVLRVGEGPADRPAIPALLERVRSSRTSA